MLEFATKQQIDRAVELALRKAMRYFNFHTTKLISQKTAINKKIIRGRLSGKIDKKALLATITTWMNPVPGVILDPKRTASGMKIAEKNVRGAFMADLKRFRQNNVRPMIRVGKARLPLMQVKIPIASEAMEAVERVFVATEVQFFKYVQDELRKVMYGV